MEVMAWNWHHVLGLVLAFGMMYYLWYSTSPEKSSKRVKRRRLTRIGLTTLVSEIETNLSIATSIMILDGPVTAEQLIQHLKQCLNSDAMFRRFRSVVANGHFTELDEFDPTRNVTCVMLPKDKTPYQYAEEVTNTPLNPDIPLWECNIIEDYDNRCYIIWRIHHCIGDGMSLVAAFVKLADDSKEIEKQIQEYMAQSQKPKGETSKKPKPTMLQLLQSLIWAIWIVIRKLGLLMFRMEPNTLFRMQGGQEKQLRHLNTLSVTKVKTLGKKFGATLNDVMLTCITGALRRTLLSESDQQLAKNIVIRAAIPVDMRSASASITSTSNKFSSLLIDLPIGDNDIKSRIKRIIESTNEAKYSFEKSFVYLMGQWMGMLPTIFIRPLVKIMTSKVSVAVTNVRGPPVTLKICGRNAISFAGYVPPPPTVNVGFAIFSMGDELGLTLLTDSNVISNPDLLLNGILDELTELETLAA